MITEASTVSYADNGLLLRYTVSNECGTTASEGVAITVYQSPLAPTLTSETTPNPLCEGSTFTLTAGMVTDMPATYTWYKDDVAVGGNMDTYVVDASGMYTVSAVNSNGCVSPVSIPLDYTFLVRPNTPTIVASGQTSFCMGGRVELEAVTSSTAATYEWYKDNDLVLSGTSNRYSAREHGSYTVIAVAANSCESGSRSEVLEVQVIAYPEIPVIIGAPKTVVRWLQDLPVPNPLEVANPAIGVTYRWYHNNIPLLKETNASLYFSPVRPQDEGLYKVVVSTLVADCSAESEAMMLEVNTKIGINNTLTLNNDGKNERIVIEDAELYNEIELIIVNRWGSEVFRMRNYDGRFTGAGLPNGTYFYNLRVVGRDGQSVTQVGHITLKQER
jgi:gliding motility-associated-like protein